VKHAKTCQMLIKSVKNMVATKLQKTTKYLKTLFLSILVKFDARAAHHTIISIVYNTL